MKYTAFIFLVFVFSIFSSCSLLADGGSQKAQVNFNKTIEVQNKQNNTNSAQETEIRQVKSKEILVWSGTVDFTNKTTDSGCCWFDGGTTEKEFPKGVEIGTNLEVDLMNCGGYLASATITYVRLETWSIAIKADTVANNVKEKIKACGGQTDDDLLSGQAFAVAPRDTKRTSIRIGKVDGRKLFAALPKDIQTRINQRLKFEPRDKQKQSLSLANNDSWTDLDGDGKVDLISIESNCKTDSDDYQCTTILRLINGKWREIGYILPA